MAANSDMKYGERLPAIGCGYAYPPASGVQIFRHAIVGVTATLEAVPAGHANAVALIGLAEERCDNRTGAGRGPVTARKGVYNIAVAGATAANIGAVVFAVDDNTLSLSGTGGRLKAGTLEAIDAEGTWVRF